MPPDFKNLGVIAKLDALHEAGLIDIKEGAEWPTPVRYLGGGDGQPIQDIWAFQPYTEGTVYGTKGGIDEDVKWLGPTDPERLGYQTQKPIGILDRIIRSSCPNIGIVLDPFCGCGTTIDAAQLLDRQWIGIDITHLAISHIKARIRDNHGNSVNYEVIGEPVSLYDAATLASEDRYQFQYWALGLIPGARPAQSDQKKGADKGIDGRLYFHDEGDGGATKQIIFSVKSGKTDVSHVRDLRGVIEREKAVIGVLISLQEPTKPMRDEAMGAGFYASPWGTKHPRLQVLSVERLLDGGKIDMPPSRDLRTFKKAPKAKKATKSGPSLSFGSDDV
jgi:hypothetical protein